MATWRKALHLAPKEVVRTAAIGAAAGSLTVKASGTNRIIDLSCDSTDPKLAADFLNTLVDQFIQKNLDDRWKATERTGEWLTTQLGDLKIKLEKSEDALQSYAAHVGLQFTTSDSGDKDKGNTPESVPEATLRQLQQELSAAKTERMNAQSKYELVSASPAQALPQVLDNDSLHGYQDKLAELRQQLAEANVSLSPTNPKVQRIQAQIQAMETAEAAEIGNVVTRIRNDYTAAVRKERLLQDEFARQLGVVADQSEEQVHYGILKREVDTNRALYESMLEKVKESSIASEMRANSFRIVDPALAPGGPYKPNLYNNALLGLMAGLFFGVVFVLLREQADRSIQQPGDAALYLGMRELGIIPAQNLGKLRKNHSSSLRMNEDEHELLELMTWQRQRSLGAECFRTVLTSILFIEGNERQPGVLVSASPNPGEGKTTVACNLGIAMAEINQRVLLIDADMRRPRIHRIFQLENRVGLTDLLHSKQTLSDARLIEASRETWIPGLHVLTSGAHSANVSTLLYSARLPEIIQLARQNFDMVIIDSPPMLHIADARLVARHADGVLLVMRAGKTTRMAAREAKRKFAADSATLLGCILTDWNPDSNGYGYDYRYYASHAAYYTNSEVKRAVKAARG
jgi:capsular exopolysaccharide synthesis family protein